NVAGVVSVKSRNRARHGEAWRKRERVTGDLNLQVQIRIRGKGRDGQADCRTQIREERTLDDRQSMNLFPELGSVGDLVVNSKSHGDRAIDDDAVAPAEVTLKVEGFGRRRRRSGESDRTQKERRDEAQRTHPECSYEFSANV